MKSPAELKAENNKSRPSRKAKGFWTKLALITIPTLLLFGTLEGAARFYAWKNYGSATRGMNWKFEYEPYLVTTTNDKLHQTYPEKGDAFRVVVLGGSTASLIPDDSLAEALEPVVGREIEVINLAQGGWILNQTRIAFLLHGMSLEPDMLITLDGANDLVTASKTLRPGITYANDFVQLGVDHPILNGAFGVLRHSQFINSLNKLRERDMEKQAHADEALLADTVEHSLEALHSLAAMTKGLDIPYAMVLQPYVTLRDNTPPEEEPITHAQAYRAEYMTRGYRVLQKRLQNEPFPGNVFVIDATRAFDQVDGQCFFDEVHLSKGGNKALCRYIAQSLLGRL